MSWAAERRLTYITGIILFVAIIVGIPVAYKLLTIKPTCHDGIQNHGETAIDKGGPCLTLNEADLLPYSVMWARSFEVRDGSYNAVAYVQNPNKTAGVMKADYVFRLYDDQQVILAERKGTTFIMPGGVTPIFESHLDTGLRAATHTTFEFTNRPFLWQRMSSSISDLTVTGMMLTNGTTVPLLKATITNTVADSSPDLSVVAVVYDSAGSAINVSGTELPSLGAYEHSDVTFSWPQPFSVIAASSDVLPRAEPILDPTAER